MPRSESVYGRLKDLEASYLGAERARRMAWDELQWEWPGFFLQSAGAWLSVAGHGLAAVLGPDRD